MYKRILKIVIAVTALSVMLAAPAGADSSSTRQSAATRYDDADDIGPRRAHQARQASWERVVREFNEVDAPDPGTESVGWSRLVRSSDDLRANVFVRGLEPGGVYTFWWVVPHGDNPAVPDDVFVALGTATVVGDSGMALVRMRAFAGQEGIEGAPFLPEGAEWSTLDDPMNSVVRVEIAYHGQAENAGGDVKAWMSDFWTGSACPEPGGTNAAGQPFCPVYLAATHLP